jgi:hypothetical protein
LPPRNDNEPFPLEAVRDLLGLCRAIYSAKKRAGASPSELRRLAAVGRDLSQAIDLAVSTRVGTVGHRAALQRAEEATHRIGEFVDALTLAEPMIVAARSRVTGATAALRKRKVER